MKYIILTDSEGYEFPIIFPTLWGHDEVAGKLALPKQKVIAAGLIRKTDSGALECMGGSGSLKIRSRPERDLAVISKYFEAK